MVQPNQTAKRYQVKYGALVFELIRRDLIVKYRRSILGYLWSLLNPLLMMTVMAIVFSNVFRFQIDHFPLYLICGQTLFIFFSESTNMAMMSIIYNAALIKKIYVPKVIFPISRILSSFITMCVSLIAVGVVVIFSGIPWSASMLLFLAPICFLLVFCCGIGLILAAMAVHFRDVTHLYSVITLAWMYATPIFYPLDAVSPSIQSIIQFNPMYQYIYMFRELIMYGNIPGLDVWIQCFVSSCAALALGLLVFRKMQKKFILYI